MTEVTQEPPSTPETSSKWGGLPVREMVDQGFYLYKRKKGLNEYMSLRRGNEERSLGPFTQEKWNLFLKEFPESERKRTGGISVLGARLKKPRALGSRYEPSGEVLDWFFWFQQQGFTGTLADFLNEIVHNYFIEQGLSLAVVIKEA